MKCPRTHCRGLLLPDRYNPGLIKCISCSRLFPSAEERRGLETIDSSGLRSKASYREVCFTGARPRSTRLFVNRLLFPAKYRDSPGVEIRYNRVTNIMALRPVADNRKAMALRRGNSQREFSDQAVIALGLLVMRLGIEIEPGRYQALWNRQAAWLEIDLNRWLAKG